MNTNTEFDNLYGRLKGIRQMRGAMTSQSHKDFNRIVETLAGMGVLTSRDVISFRVIELAGIEPAERSGIPERAAQLMALLDHRKPILLRDVIEEKFDSLAVKEQVREISVKPAEGGCMISSPKPKELQSKDEKVPSTLEEGLLSGVWKCRFKWWIIGVVFLAVVAFAVYTAQPDEVKIRILKYLGFYAPHTK
jgi:hypothetical protein